MNDYCRQKKSNEAVVFFTNSTGAGREFRFSNIQIFHVFFLIIKCTAQKMKFPIKDFFSECDQIHKKHLLKKSFMENFIFCAVILFSWG